MIFGYQGLMPKVHERAFVSDTAVLIGDVEIGEESSVWFGAVLHGCTIGDGVLVGIGAKVLDGAIIGEGAIVAAGSVVREDEEIPSRTLVAGIPAKPKKKLDRESSERLRGWSCTQKATSGLLKAI